MSEFEQKSKATAEKSARAAQQSYAAAAENMRDYSVKLIKIAQANAGAAFEFAHDLATAKSPSDLATVWTAYARKQFEMLSDQTKELTAMGQRMAGETGEPIARNVKQTFDKTS
jgi:phasin